MVITSELLLRANGSLSRPLLSNVSNMSEMLHTVYKGPEGETTQWEDIQVKLGNMAPRPKPWKPEAYTPEEEEQKDKDWLDKKDEGELSDLEDEFGDDRALEEYRYTCTAIGALWLAAVMARCHVLNVSAG